MKQIYLILLAFIISIQAFAQIPPNDEIQNAVNITSLPFADINVQTQNATAASGGGMSGGCDIGNNLSRVYYKIPSFGETQQSITVTLTNGASDSFILFYQGSQGTVVDDSDLGWIPGLVTGCSFNEENSATYQTSPLYDIYIVVSNPTNETNIIFLNNNDTNIVNIPDPNFKSALLAHTNPVIDTNGDGEIQVNEAFVVDRLSVTSGSISDLTGIEAFVNLEDLNCSYNNLTSLDLSFNTELDTLNSFGNNLNNLNITQNLNLESLNIGNYIGSSVLDISQNVNLKRLYLFDCGINSINVNHLSILETLILARNNLSSLDLSLNPNLKWLDVNTNNFSALDLSSNNLLEELDIRHNELPTVDLTNLVNLKSLECGNFSFFSTQNILNSLDLTQNVLLENLEIENSNLSALNLLQNINLENLRWTFSNVVDIDISNNINLIKIDLDNNLLSTLDLSQNQNLLRLKANSNSLTALDVSQNPNLEFLEINDNVISNLDVLNNSNLFSLVISANPISAIDLSQNSLLALFKATSTSIQEINLSNNANLESVQLQSNPFLQSINFKNSNNAIIDGGSTSNNSSTSGIFGGTFLSQFRANNNPNLQTICVDDVGFATTNFTKDATAIFVEDCSITSVNYNIIQGVLAFDNESDGCDTNDIVVANQLVNTTNGTDQYGTFTNASGFYAIDVVEDTYTTSVEGMPNYITTTPTSIVDTFTSLANTEIADFCITANQNNINDINVVIIPVNEARPGFNSEYQLVFENSGILPVSGDVTFNFDDMSQVFVSASEIVDNQTANSLTFNYTNLQPFEIRTIDIEMNTFTPPTVNGDDILNFTASISPTSNDQNPNDNTFNLAQIVVNSFDPNDKTVLQGSEITLPQASEYLNYVVRFQNTGTASAIKVIITDNLDSKLDFETLRPVSSSHDYSLRVIDGDFLEFTFDNINLPAQQDDDAGSNGFIAFKIKPKTDVQIGDIINGKANIYFDFNAPIITNTVATEIVTTLSIEDVSIDSGVVIYPNPSANIFNIKAKDGIQINNISLIGLSGKELYSSNKAMDRIDLSRFATGIYFLKIETNKGLLNKRIIKK
ncbi:T9SS type A sorting domain-containing protein [Lacinutrix sp.]|uniref:DUF7619 domain-containing protein n=1 Tax=Lacinutrix sp. TaxID=1937692 RepID=UPI0025BA174C|nr:T9SS type A sorting domain-containing protein [Lacinutrix sp.]